MTTVPAQSMIGTSSAWWLVGSMVLAVALLLISRAFWRFALRFYTSASS
jgi:ABC-2 type transport system permease protein